MVINIIDQYQSVDAQGLRRFHVAFPRPTKEAEEELRTWCEETFGKSTIWLHGVWEDRIRYGEVTFAKESNLALFVMRWK